MLQSWLMISWLSAELGMYQGSNGLCCTWFWLRSSMDRINWSVRLFWSQIPIYWTLKQHQNSKSSIKLFLCRSSTWCTMTQLTRYCYGIRGHNYSSRVLFAFPASQVLSFLTSCCVWLCHRFPPIVMPHPPSGYPPVTLFHTFCLSVFSLLGRSFK